MRVGSAGEGGRRQFTIHSRPHEAGLLADAVWTCHAVGALAPDAEPADMAWSQVWPPEGAEPLDLSQAYDSLTERGYGYGPAFQGLRAAWRRGDEVYAEVALSPAEREQAGKFGIHPALLDAALHPVVLGLAESGRDDASAAPGCLSRGPASVVTPTAPPTSGFGFTLTATAESGSNWPTPWASRSSQYSLSRCVRGSSPARSGRRGRSSCSSWGGRRFRVRPKAAARRPVPRSSAI